MNNARLAGFTLIELVIFIVVVSIGVVGILSVMNLNVRYSTDPMMRKQAAALADSILEEILLKEYSDPDGGANVVEAGRSTYDDVDDYNGLTNTAFTDLAAAGLANYGIAIAVAAPAALNGVTMKRVTVTVTGGA
ncbi:MAG: hypothetical protein ACXV8Q_13635, partial [Methylobacter sp.]